MLRLTLELICCEDEGRTAGPNRSCVAALGPDWREAHAVVLEPRVALQPHAQAGHVATVLLKKPAGRSGVQYDEWRIGRGNGDGTHDERTQKKQE